MARSWYSFQNAAANDVATVSIFDEIGMWGITAREFIGDLANVKAKVLNVDINSPGGSVFEGVAIYNALMNRVKSGTVVNVTVMGVAASIASYIAMAGSKITMPANTYMMIHNPWGRTGGNADEMRDYADLLDKIALNLVATYVARTGQTEDEVKAMLSKDTWLSAAEAKALGFCDEVSVAYEVSASFDLERMPDNVKAIFNAAKKPDAEALAAAQALTDASMAEAARVAADTAQALAYAAAAEVPFADQVFALCETAGVSAYAGLWAMEQDASLITVQSAIANARQITALCALIKMPSAADSLIRARKSVAEARTDITNLLALADEQKVTDTTLKTSNTPIHNAGPSAVKTADIWAARRK